MNEPLGKRLPTPTIKNKCRILNKCQVFCGLIILLYLRGTSSPFPFLASSPSNMTDVRHLTTEPLRVIQYHVIYE